MVNPTKLNNLKLLKYLSVFILLSFIIGTVGQISYSAPMSVYIFPRDSKPYGLSYEDHVKNYWNFTVGMKADGHPWADKTGKDCRKGQENSNSSIFYLPTNKGNRDSRICKIPSGLGLFIPIIVGEFSGTRGYQRTKFA